MAKKETKNKKKSELSIDEEMLMWTSYRYAIGRKTYVSSLAFYIAKKYYPLLSEQRMLFTASDIRREIEQHFNWMCFNFHYDGTVSREARNPYENCIEFLMNEIIKEGDTQAEIEEKILKIKDVEVYHENYKDDAPHKYRISYRAEGDSRTYISPSEFSEYQCWAALAACFDKQHYKKVHVKYEGKEEDIICFETWIEDSLPVENEPGYYRWWPWHYRKVYVGVDNFIQNGERAGYIWGDYIVSVEDYDAREDKTNI